MRRPGAPVALLAVALASSLLVACGDDEPGAGGARLQVAGRAEVTRGDGSVEIVNRSSTLAAGDVVRMQEGRARLELAGGARLEARAASGRASEVRVDQVPVLTAGDLLVEADDPLTVEAAGTEVTVEDGASRLSRSLAVSAAVYAGRATVDSAGQVRPVPALRQIEVPALGRPPAAPAPLAYDSGDPWDRRFLGAAIGLGQRLAALARAYTSSLDGDEGRTVGFFEIVLPGLADEAEFTAGLLDPDRDPGDTLIGATVALLGEQGSFARRWRQVFEFRDAGAEWGLVALDHEVEGAPLLGTVEQALAASPLEFATPPPPPAGLGSPSPGTTPPGPPAPGPAATGPGAGAGPPAASGGTSAPGGATPGGGGSAPPGGSPPPGSGTPGAGDLGGATDPVDEVVSGLTEPVPPPNPFSTR